MSEHIHRCHADGCETPVPPKMLMCRRHWFMVPRLLQARIWQHYVPGQEIRKDPTPAYLEVMMQAIQAVKDKEAQVEEFNDSFKISKAGDK